MLTVSGCQRPSLLLMQWWKTKILLSNSNNKILGLIRLTSQETRMMRPPMVMRPLLAIKHLTSANQEKEINYMMRYWESIWVKQTLMPPTNKTRRSPFLVPRTQLLLQDLEHQRSTPIYNKSPIPKTGQILQGTSLHLALQEELTTMEWVHLML